MVALLCSFKVIIMKVEKKPRWSQFKRTIDKLRSGGWFSPKDLETQLKLPHRTATHNLRKGLYLGIFKQDGEKGPYAWIDYCDEEPIIRQVIEDHYPRDPNVMLQTKYGSLTEKADDIVSEAAIRAGKDPKDIGFRKIVFEVIGKCIKEKVP